MRRRTSKVEHMPMGKYAYEQQLINNIRIELERYCTVNEIHPKTRYRLFIYFQNFIHKENVVKIHTHPIKRIYVHLMTGRIPELMTFTESHFDESVLDQIAKKKPVKITRKRTRWPNKE